MYYIIFVKIMEKNNNFSDISCVELFNLNGGSPAGFILGYMAGTIVGYTGAIVIAINGGTQEEAEKTLLASLTFCSTIGALVV